ncbi:MAG: hypothetical protein ACK4MV_05860 [Beijerinckiaceae bacterium]
MNRRSFLCSLLGLAAVAALPGSKAEAAQPVVDAALDSAASESGDLPASGAAEAQYYQRRRVRQRRRVVVYSRPVVYRRRRVVVYRRPVVYRRRTYVRRVYW